MLSSYYSLKVRDCETRARESTGQNLHYRLGGLRYKMWMMIKYKWLLHLWKHCFIWASGTSNPTRSWGDSQPLTRWRCCFSLFPSEFPTLPVWQCPKLSHTQLCPLQFTVIFQVERLLLQIAPFPLLQCMTIRVTAPYSYPQSYWTPAWSKEHQRSVPR